MARKPPSQRGEQHQLRTRLRAAGSTWAEIAEIFRMRYKVNARVALRLARGWSQREVAERWTALWPDDPKTLKNISTWEQWPAESGHEPGLRVLERLARIYECSSGDLIADLGDHRHHDVAALHKIASGSPTPSPAPLGVGSIPSADLNLVPGLIELTAHLPNIDTAEAAQVVSMWARRLNPDLDRRTLLFALSNAFAVAAAAPIFEHTTDDRQRLAAILDDPGRLDVATLDRTATIIANCRRHGDVLGPQVTLQCVMAEREILGTILRGHPPNALITRAQSAYAELNQLTGWLLFNLGDYRTAGHYYDEARAVAHSAHDVELVTYVLCTMSHLATWRGQPRVGIDHAMAAQSWARQSGSPRAQAYAADIAARAYAADDDQAYACDKALDEEHTALMKISDDDAGADRWYFYDDSFYWGTKAETSLLLSRPDDAITAADRAIALVDHTNLHNRVLTQTLQAEAIIQKGDETTACTLIAEAARLSVANTSSRIDQRIGHLRRLLTPWERTAPVRDLDEQLRLYRRST